MLHDLNRRDFMKASAAATGAVWMTGTVAPRVRKNSNRYNSKDPNRAAGTL